MPAIRGVATALPDTEYNVDDINNIGTRWLSEHPEKLEQFRRFLRSSKNQRRYFSIDGDKILSLNGLKHRSELFEITGPRLGESALRSALCRANIEPKQISTHIFTSCTCPSIPAIDGVIIEKVGLLPTTKRAPIYQQGCAGGIVGLSLAAQMAKSGGSVALTSVELCSLVFHPSDSGTAQLVGAAIFGDGAGSVIVDDSDEGLVVVDSESFLVPNSRHLMGYDTLDDGFHLRLDRELPYRLAELAPQRVSQFLAKHKLTLSEIEHWLFHPGGIKILDSLEGALCAPHQAIWAREVLSEVGNLSSASVLFVLNRFLDSGVMKSGDNIVMLGVGPGLTIELILFQYR